MAHAKLFAVALLFLLPSMGVFASTPVTLDTGLFFDAAGTMWYKTVGGTNTLMYPDLQIAKTLPVQTNLGPANVAITRQPRIDLSRVGASVVGFAKLLGPVGVGISVAQLICSQSKICDSGSGIWQKSADAEFVGYQQSFTGQAYWHFGQSGGWAYDLTPLDGGKRFDSIASACANMLKWENTNAGGNGGTGGVWLPILSTATTSITTTTAQCNFVNSRRDSTYPNGVSWSRQTARTTGDCPTNYVKSGSSGCTLSGNSVPTTPTDADWTASKTSLSTQNMIQPLLDASQPIPVYLPPVAAPITQTIGTTSTTNPDGTRTDTTTTLTTTDTSSASAPNSYTVNETTVTNVYNTSNVLINTTTTEAAPPAPIVSSTSSDTSTLAKEATLQEVRNALVSPVMPDLSPTTTGGNTALDTASALVGNLITDQAVTNKKTDLGWSFLPQLPSGSCATVPFGVRTWLVNYDWCTDLGKARTMWGWLFAMLGALYIWRRGTAALSGQS